MRATVVSRCWLGAGVLLADMARAEPAFDRFPAAVVRPSVYVPPRLTDARSRLFRSALREAAARSPDFAGHYALARIGCGAACVMLAAIDRVTGRVAWFPSTVSNWPIEVTEPVEYRRTSRLLAVEGQLDEKGPSTTRLYLFDGTRFNLLQGRGRG